MDDKATSNAQPYEIRLKGHLDARWADQFEGMTITLKEDGKTLLSGPVADQAALHGLFKKVRDLGLTLLSINQIQFEDTHQNHSKQGEINMNSSTKIDTKALLSTLWVVVMINMAYADILSIHIPGAFDEVTKTSISTGASIPQLMLVGAIMMEIPLAMIILSRVLKYGMNRWVNIIAGIFTIAYIWGGMASYPHYIFIASVETLCLLLIVGVAWTWRNNVA